MRNYTPTPEQQAAAEAKRARMKEIASKIASLSDAQRNELAAKVVAITVEGHALSVRNLCLLALQYPNATIVGGFNQWKAAGRFVRKGEKGLTIYAPAKGKKTTDPDSGEVTQGEMIFVPITVFDVSQTDAAAN